MNTNIKDYHGITITNIWDDKLEKKLNELVSDPILARIVVDKVDDYTDYIEAFEMVNGIGVIPMLQICDSYLDGKLTDEEYDAREMWMLENLAEYAPFVEIANEIGPTNNWSSANQIKRARKSSDRWVGHERVVTYFWPGVLERGLDFNKWKIDNYVFSEHQLLSFYPNKVEDFADLPRYIPGIVDGLSECGMEEWQGSYSPKMKALVKSRAYKIGPPVCWWDWQNEA